MIGRAARGYGGAVKWKVGIVLGAAIGAVFWAARRKTRQEASDAQLWAEATDPVVRFGDA